MRRWLRNNRGFLAFLLCLGLFRTVMADWNPIPSGSMRPTLLEGDVVLVNRLAYDLKVPLTDIALAPLGQPQRFDVVTFTSPQDGVRLIKRIVGLPGDLVEMRDEVLYINGVAARYTPASPPPDGSRPASESLDGLAHRVQFLPTAAALSSFAPVTVPPDQYFMLGDNRDNSADSRYIGLVPRKLLIGRAHHILVSADILDHWQPRLDRIAHAIQ